jgi:hypothetical protein
MGFIASTITQLKNAFTPKLDWPAMGDSVKGAFKRGQTAVLIKDNDLDEFQKRYKNLRGTAIITLVFTGIAFFSILFAGNFRDFFYSCSATTLFGMCYFRYAYMLWVCRYAVATGADLSAPVQATGGNFLSAIAANPLSLLPLKLPEARPEKGASK